LIKLFPYILFVYLYFSTKMASPGNQHCANCIGTLSFPIALFTQYNSAQERSRLTWCRNQAVSLAIHTFVRTEWVGHSQNVGRGCPQWLRPSRKFDYKYTTRKLPLIEDRGQTDLGTTPARAELRNCRWPLPRHAADDVTMVTCYCGHKSILKERCGTARV